MNNAVRWLAVGTVMLIAAISVRAATPPTPASTTAKQAAEAHELLASLKNPKLTPEARRALVDQVLALGEEGPKLLAQQAGQNLRSKQPTYLSRFERAAENALRARVKAGGGASKVEQEVIELRKTVLDVSRAQGLTKEMIVQTADPALAKLTAILSVTVEQVFEQQPELASQRQELLDLSKSWHEAVGKLPEERRKSMTMLPDPEQLDGDLRTREELAALLAMPMSRDDRAVLTANQAAAAQLDPEEVAGILAVNVIRIRVGIGAVAIDPKLVAASRGHSKDMTEKNFFAHESPIAGKETPWKRAQLAGTSAGAENIYTGSTRGQDAIRAWWHSPGHHTNMMGGHKRVGLGRFEKMWTQMFG